MLDMRFRLLEVMEGAKLPTAYALSRASDGAIPMATASRLVKDVKEGRAKRIDFDTLDALCATLKCKPNDLFELDSQAKPAKRKRG